MANPPQPTRTWLRLPSIARPVIPEATPTPTQPRPPLARPPTRTPAQPQEPPPPPAADTIAPVQKSPPKPPAGPASVPTSPLVKPTTAPSSSLPTSPAPPPTAAPTTTTFSLPPSPVVAQKPPPSSSVPTSPTPKPMPTISSVPTSPTTKPLPTTATTTSFPSPSHSSRTVKPMVQTTTPESPKPKPTAPPPSPLILPPAKIKSDSEIPLEPEQKTVLVQKTISTDKPKPMINGRDSDISKKDPRKELEIKEKSPHLKKLNSDSENGGMRVITIAGENKGAYMEVIRSPNKKNVFEGTSHNLHESKIWGKSSSSSSSEEQEGSHLKKKEKSHKGKSAPMSTFMNSNVQGVNNSLVYNSTCTHHDPGVHLALSRKPATGGGGFYVKERSNGNRG